MNCSICNNANSKGFILGKNSGKPYCFDCAGRVLIKNEELRGKPRADKELKKFLNSLGKAKV